MIIIDNFHYAIEKINGFCSKFNIIAENTQGQKDFDSILDVRNISIHSNSSYESTEEDVDFEITNLFIEETIEENPISCVCVQTQYTISTKVSLLNSQVATKTDLLKAILIAFLKTKLTGKVCSIHVI